jgi:hypothetical protein
VPLLFGPSHSIEYTGRRRYVRLDVKSSSPAPIAAVAILTNPRNCDNPIRVVAAIYPDDSAEARERFDRKCYLATDVARKALHGGATLGEVRTIVNAFVRTEIDSVELARATPVVQSRMRSNANLRRAPSRVTKQQAEAAVKLHGTQAKAAEALNISERRLRTIINGK